MKAESKFTGSLVLFSIFTLGYYYLGGYFTFRRLFYKIGLNFRGVALFPSPSALNTLCGILYHEDFDRCARASALAGKFHLTCDTPTTYYLGLGGLIFRGVALFPSPSALNTLCAIPYHKDFERGSARPRARSRLHPNGKRCSRLFLLRLHPNGKRCSRLFLLRLHPC